MACCCSWGGCELSRSMGIILATAVVLVFAEGHGANSTLYKLDMSNEIVSLAEVRLWTVYATSAIECAMVCRQMSDCAYFVYSQNENGDLDSITGNKSWTQADIRNVYHDISIKKEHYLGCFVDRQTPNRDMMLNLGYSYQRTPDECIQECYGLGYIYAGLQYGLACWCSDTFGKYGPAPESECYLTCTGNASLTCGGHFRNAIYAIEDVDDVTVGSMYESTKMKILRFYLCTKKKIADPEDSGSLPDNANCKDLHKSHDTTINNIDDPHDSLPDIRHFTADLDTSFGSNSLSGSSGIVTFGPFSGSRDDASTIPLEQSSDIVQTALYLSNIAHELTTDNLLAEINPSASQTSNLDTESDQSTCVINVKRKDCLGD
ncbi:hypothetical protein ScPMuIL_017062 [Solemya velum]